MNEYHKTIDTNIGIVVINSAKKVMFLSRLFVCLSPGLLKQVTDEFSWNIWNAIGLRTRSDYILGIFWNFDFFNIPTMPLLGM